MIKTFNNKKYITKPEVSKGRCHGCIFDTDSWEHKECDSFIEKYHGSICDDAIWKHIKLKDILKDL